MRKKIGELLIESGAVSQEQIRKALGQQRAFGHGQRLGSVIVTLGFASSAAVARALARQFDLPFVELPEIPDEVRSIVSLDFQAEHRLVPFRVELEGRGERLHVAVDDPSDLSIVDELRFQLNKPIRVFVAAADDVDRALELIRGEMVEPLLDWEPPAPPPPRQESEGVLDELLGEPESASSVPSTSKPPDISEEDLRVLEDIERIANGGEATLHTEKVKPARRVASLIRLLIRKRVIREEEFLEELSRK